ncbi:MAG TPA: nitrous oxide reductase accessory protein NosL [Candidatus Brocadiales bacterium]|nr:nitrous oxide reductase accessory protein NosL [Candidatus Brocadiales bacterium]
MTRYGIIIALAVVFGIAGCAKNEVPVFRCDMCGMDVSKSETRYRLKLHPPQAGEKYACSFSCANLLNENLKDKVSAVETLDFNTANFININTATFVAHSNVIPRGSMPPSLLAFSRKADAELFTGEHKGKILDLEGVKKLIADSR